MSTSFSPVTSSFKELFPISVSRGTVCAVVVCVVPTVCYHAVSDGVCPVIVQLRHAKDDVLKNSYHRRRCHHHLAPSRYPSLRKDLASCQLLTNSVQSFSRDVTIYQLFQNYCWWLLRILSLL